VNISVILIFIGSGRRIFVTQPDGSCYSCAKLIGSWWRHHHTTFSVWSACLIRTSQNIRANQWHRLSPQHPDRETPIKLVLKVSKFYLQRSLDPGKKVNNRLG